MHNSPTKKRNEKKALLLLPNKGLMGTDNPSSPFAAACTINVKTTPISENSPSLQFAVPKAQTTKQEPCIWCKFSQFLESYRRTSSPPTNNLNNLVD
jgi:hypothetical protein